MRLIDADEIHYTDMLSSKGNGDYENVGMVTQDEIDALSTVDAIPISFIEGVIDLSRKVGADRHAESLEILLRDWAERKEE